MKPLSRARVAIELDEEPDIPVGDNAMSDLGNDHALSYSVENVLAREWRFDDVSQTTGENMDPSPDPGLGGMVLSKPVWDRVLIELTCSLVGDVAGGHFEAIAEDAR
jgi:hypothetical protein